MLTCWLYPVPNNESQLGCAPAVRSRCAPVNRTKKLPYRVSARPKNNEIEKRYDHRKRFGASADMLPILILVITIKISYLLYTLLAQLGAKIYPLKDSDDSERSQI